jgi:hypothetical protein
MTERTGADVVHFEIVDLADAVRLVRRLGSGWCITFQEREDVNLVTVELRRRPGDLALLLREVEQWITEGSLCAIRFELDGREYVIQAGEVDWKRSPGGGC